MLAGLRSVKPPDRYECPTGSVNLPPGTSSRHTPPPNWTRGDLYVFPPLLEACCRVIGGALKLSSFAARTGGAGSKAQDLHMDVPPDSPDWPLLGFILMVDDFRPDNGTTRFVPGSHRWPATPEDTMPDVRAAHEGEVLACAAAGSLLVFNGSAWHGHTANRSNGPR